MSNLVSYHPIQDLIDAARQALEDGGNRRLLVRPLEELDKALAFRNSKQGQAVVERSRELHVGSDCDVDIDEGTIVTDNETDGWWVMGWLFVHHEELPELAPNCGAEEVNDGKSDVSVQEVKPTAICERSEIASRTVNQG